MAQTIQSISNSNTQVGTAKSQYAMSSSIGLHQEESEPEDNISLLFSVASDLNSLCIKLEKLHHVMKMANIKLRIRAKKKEKGK